MYVYACVCTWGGCVCLRSRQTRSLGLLHQICVCVCACLHRYQYLKIYIYEEEANKIIMSLSNNNNRRVSVRIIFFVLGLSFIIFILLVVLPHQFQNTIFSNITRTFLYLLDRKQYLSRTCFNSYVNKIPDLHKFVNVSLFKKNHKNQY